MSTNPDLDRLDVALPSNLVLAGRRRKKLVIGGKQVDGRGLEARRYRDLCAELAVDMGGEPSTAQWMLIQRAAALGVQLELSERRIATGEAIDVTEFVRLTNALVRLLSVLGLDRRARDVTPRAAPLLDDHTAALLTGGRDDA